LLLQLEQFDSKTEGLADIRMLIRDHLEQLGSRDYARLLKTTRLSEDRLQQLINFIQSLNPKPGSYISPNRAEYVIPDIYVRKINGEWRVTLNPETAPRIRINPLYAGYVKKSGRGKDSSYLRNSMQEARWFLKSLQSRSDTLLRVGKAIVDRQRLFLEYGDEGMKPMVLRDIAEELDMHESTISRVTTQKYMHTPRGVFEFKFFFSSHVSTVDGGECSATAIRAMVKKLIENENPRKPMSDNKISAFLVKEGINVARRTVAKYREAMSIPPSNERKRLT
jgi:RNA polymerase sigma-54 factor